VKDPLKVVLYFSVLVKCFDDPTVLAKFCAIGGPVCEYDNVWFWNEYCFAVVFCGTNDAVFNGFDKGVGKCPFGLPR